jgi:hypothetical protein
VDYNLKNRLLLTFIAGEGLGWRIDGRVREDGGSKVDE